MTIKTPTSLKSFFEKGDRPSEVEFAHLIDSTYSGEIGAAIVSAAAVSVGVVKIASASGVTILDSATAGEGLLAASTPTSARTLLGSSTVGDALFVAATATAARATLGAAPIVDDSGNEVISLTGVTLAVNDLTVSNAATGNAPAIAATGDDANIDVELTPVGTGNLTVGGLAHYAGELLHVREEQPSGTQGGTFTAGSYVTRVLNTVKTNNIAGASLATNQITLPAGTYYVDGSAPARQVGTHKTKLRNVTDSTDAVIGTSETASNANSVHNRSFIAGEFTIATGKTFELQHRCSTTFATSGLGTATTFGEVEVQADVRIWRLK